MGSRVLAVCLPASDAGFAERVRRVVARDRWDLDSHEGIALMQAVLRESYPAATVLSHDGVSAGGMRRTVVLDVYRDGPPGTADFALRWAEAVYDVSGAAAYRVAARIVGEGPAAEAIVEEAFRYVVQSVVEGVSVDAGGSAVEAAALRLANDARASTDAALSAPTMTGAVVNHPSVQTPLRTGGVPTALSGRATDCLISSQREVLELAVLADLKVREIAERTRTTSAAVHSLLKDALLAVGSGVPLSPDTTLARWRNAQREWARLPTHDPERAELGLGVAHAWLDYQVISGAVRPETVILVTDTERRFVAASANAAQALARPVVGLRIDDLTADYARPLVPELWTLFDEFGGMHGEYDCDRPGQLPLRTQFHGVWSRPLPDLQVGYLQLPVSAPAEPIACD